MSPTSPRRNHFRSFPSRLRQKPKMLLLLVFLGLLIFSTLILLNKEYGEIRDSEAAKNETLVFKRVDSSSINNAQKLQVQKLTENKINSSTIFTLSIKSGIANVGIISIPIDGQNYIFNKPLIEKNGAIGTTSWKSQVDIEGEKSTALFTYADNHLAGTFQAKPGKTYRISEIDTNIYVLREYNEGMGIKDDVMMTTQSGVTGQLQSVLNDLSVVPEPRVIKVLLTYDPHAREHFRLPNGSSSVVAEVNHQMQLSKDAFRTSGFVHELRVVGIHQMSGSINSLNVDYIENNPEVFSDIALRAVQTQADIVVASVSDVGLEVDFGEVCGWAGAMPQQNVNPLLKRIAIVKYTCYWAPHVFPHEIGHLFGADHDRDNAVMGPDGMNHGYLFPDYSTLDGINYGDIGTIMSYPGGHYPELNYFSNPNTILDKGIHFGNPDFADNVRVMNAIGQVVSGYSWGSSGTGGSGGTKGCGEVCANASQCQNGFSCIDISAKTAGNECWNESMCIIAPQRNRRISGKVLDCNGNPKANVEVATKGYRFNKSATTNAQGIFQIWETNNECSVEKDWVQGDGQNFTVVVGKDAVTTQTDYFSRVTSPVFSKPEINCGNINCNSTSNQASGGPARENYHLSVGAFVNNPNVYNTYVCEEDGNFLSGFDFKQVNCPTPTPTPLTCNSTCTSDAQCSSVNSNWYCATQFNYGGWSDVSSNVGSIQYKIGNGTTVYTESGATTGFNTHVNGTKIEQHLVKSGKVFYREFNGTSWNQYWSDVTSNLPSKSGWTILDFNSYKKQNGKIEQHFIRKNNSNNTIEVMTRNNDNGWNNNWTNVVSNLNGVGSGIVTGFTAYVDKDGYVTLNMVRNGQLWEGSNRSGWANLGWKNITSGLNGCAGTTSGKCGNTTLLNVERSIDLTGKEELYLVRSGGKVYYRVSTATEERCRLRGNPYTATCTN
jgi:hypothetical protein